MTLNLESARTTTALITMSVLETTNSDELVILQLSGEGISVGKIRYDKWFKDLKLYVEIQKADPDAPDGYRFLKRTEVQKHALEIYSTLKYLPTTSGIFI